MSVMTRTGVVVADCGDSAVRLTAEQADLDHRWHVFHAIAAALADYVTDFAITGIIPTYDALLVEFDCSTITHDDIRGLLGQLADQPTDRPPRPSRQFD